MSSLTTTATPLIDPRSSNFPIEEFAFLEPFVSSVVHENKKVIVFEATRDQTNHLVDISNLIIVVVNSWS